MYLCPQCKNQVLEGTSVCGNCGTHFIIKKENTENSEINLSSEASMHNTAMENTYAVNAPMGNSVNGENAVYNNIPVVQSYGNIPYENVPYGTGNLPTSTVPYNNPGYSMPVKPKERGGWTGFHTAIVIILALITVIVAGMLIYWNFGGDNDNERDYDYEYEDISSFDYSYVAPNGEVSAKPNASNYVPSINTNSDYGSDISEEYILYGSDKRYISKSEILDMTKEELRLARNEFYARRGRIFAAEDLKDYFESKSWYEGTVSSNVFDDSVFNEYEKANLELIIEYEKEMGFR